MEVMPFSLLDVPSVSESRVSSDFLATMPPNEAPAPWTVQASAIVWWCKATPAATEALPPALRARGKAAVVIGGMVRYADTPVGVYDEVFGAIGLRVGRHLIGTIPFMSVDSPTSLVGGRGNWSIPKTLSNFTGAPADGDTFAATSATGQHWRVSALPSVRLGVSLPVFSRMRVIQEFPDGSLRGTRLKANGKMRYANLDVDVSSDGDLPSWLPSGRHKGAVLSSTRFTLGAPTPFHP